ncbi:methyltransferase domain-containing protein [Methylobacterium sp. GC_Met_2]|uniref:class I SAM-dependent methyltransferase n=1 Tax=Methylobacterium sp. GC_Met_2 TaxID=2937376 RepID=UPI00226B200F|nr:methyltransferase domain-containing protein [Methylobacterium sp. GC_Met_2]
MTIRGFDWIAQGPPSRLRAPARATRERPLMSEPTYTEYGTLAEYTAQSEPTHFDDRTFRDEWQNEVYAEAYAHFRDRGYRRITDFGCGSGFKLVKYFPAPTTIGIEIEPSLSHVRAQYPDREWRSGEELVHSLRDAEMIITSDVIEHLPDPGALLQAFADSPAEFFVISTPALELLAERKMSPRLGPPANPSHIREWTTDEFHKFVSQYLRVTAQKITNIPQCTQMIFARKK